MAISVFDMFSIGIGPSSSHTVGPMRAAKRFALKLKEQGLLEQTSHINAELYGSLGHTGKGHGSDKAVVIGLMGESPETVDPDSVAGIMEQLKESNKLLVLNQHEINFHYKKQLVFQRRKSLPGHPNGMCFTAYAGEQILLSKIYYSVGGGFVVNEDADAETLVIDDDRKLPYPFTTGAQLLEQCKTHGLSISSIMLANESAWRERSETEAYLLDIWQTMRNCIKKGCDTEGILPGGLQVKRRAAHLYRRLKSESASNQDPLKVMDWVNLYALAVNEENAAGGRVVTAPTNGAAGIIPAVMHYYQYFKDKEDTNAMVRFLLTAGAIGILFKENASISGAEVGCQGEVGVACSMAAAGLAELLGGNVEQCENAAEIAMEHNLGLTCDPVAGLVQVPCIERNAMAAVKAINAARLALHGDGSHKVSLDKVIKTMRETGRDMKVKYKETARGGLAVNIIEC
jgi:L-serine dehydratase